MFSDALKQALEREVVGQPQAIDSVVRGVTRLLSGLTPTERSWCAYLFVGPPGTGRAHLVRTLARALYRQEELLTLNCNPGGHPDPWQWLSQQFAPHVEGQALRQPTGNPASIVLINDLENANKEFYPVLARVLETGQVPLQNGRIARLDNCLIFLTSSICAAEILDTDRMGFSSTSQAEAGDEEQRTIVEFCRGHSEDSFGLDLMQQIDRLIVFRKLEEDHLARLLDRHFARMSRWLSRSGIRCELLPEASAYLLERTSSQKALGARSLIRTHNREVEFPLADLLLSNQLEEGSVVLVGHKPDEEHLHFTVRDPSARYAEQPTLSGLREIPVG